MNTTLTWDWITNNPANDPQPDLTATLTFDVSVGNCSVGTADDFSSAESFANGGFLNSTNPDSGFVEATSAYAGKPSQLATTTTHTCTKTFGGDGFVTADVRVYTLTEAYASKNADETNGFAHAGSSTATLTAVNPE